MATASMRKTDENLLYLTFMRAARIISSFATSTIYEWGGDTRGITIPDAKRHGVGKPMTAKRAWLSKEDVVALLDHGFFEGREVLVVYFENEEKTEGETK